MPDRFDSLPAAPLTLSHLLHGGDYNPEQWISTPEVWDEDMRLMRAAHCNSVSIGIFSWVALEPAEGTFTFDWLDTIIGKLTNNGIGFNLATPGGAKPAWLAHQYPQTLRVDPHGRRELWGQRHNHCFTSPVFREKCRIINTKLAERYGRHPGLVMWHVNNEYSGECHCNLCSAAFQNWLRARYDNSLQKLNDAWWARFWSHEITDWKQIDPPSPIGENAVHGHNIDWKRFCSDQTIDCFLAESAPLRKITPNVPVTTNFMGQFSGLDYYKFSKVLDVISWDSYPSFHDRPNDWLEGVLVSFIHSQRRAMKRRPFVMMECSPSVQNYKPVNKLKRPGLHKVESLQAIAHGSDAVLYFQWRKSRGSCEKFHGAVVDHFATEKTRVFQEVADVGKTLEKLDAVVGSVNQAEVAIIYDYQNRWAIDDTIGPRNQKKDYMPTCAAHFRPFWSAGVDVDIIGEEADFTAYKLLIAPMLYMLLPGVAERIKQFVEAGGTFVTTYLSGLVNESDLCFQNGFPGPLKEVVGVWAEELDTLYDDESVQIVSADGNDAGLTGSYEAGVFCDLIHTEGAKILATYGGEFYKGSPAVTVNPYGKGEAYYIASRNDARFHGDFYNRMIDKLNLPRALGVNLPDGISATVRKAGSREFTFVFSFRQEDAEIDLGQMKYTNLVTGEPIEGKLLMKKYDAVVLERR